MNAAVTDAPTPRDAGEGGAASGSPTHAGPVKAKKRGKALVILPVVLLVGGGLVAYEIITHEGLQSTDNAQVEAEVVAVPTRIGGVVTQVLFEDNQRVAAGDPLAILDDGPARARVAQAEAAVAAAEAQAKAADSDVVVATTNASGSNDVAAASKITAQSTVTTARVQLREGEAAVRAAQAAYSQAKANKTRDEALFNGGALAKSAYEATATAAQVAASNLDAARARLATLRAGVAQAESRIGEADARLEQTRDVDSVVAQAAARAAAAHAQVEVARAALALARLELSYTTVVAPRAGVMSKKTVAVGQMLAPGQALAQLVTDGRWVTANFKETQITHMRVGQPVEIDVDAFPDHPLRGHVESFADGTGARFTLLPPDNATGNYTKVVQRVPVRVRLDDEPGGVALRAGLSVEVTVDTNVAAAPGATSSDATHARAAGAAGGR